MIVVKMKHRCAVLSIAAVLHAGPAMAAGERLTQRCSPPPSNKVHMEVTGEARQAIEAVIARPDSNPALYEQLWRPAAIEPFFGNSWAIVLDYPGPLDPYEMAASIAANIDLARLGITQVGPSSNGRAGGICFTNPPAVKVTLTEFFHAGLGHYFLSSSEAETRSIESGAAGPGWQRTGETFLTTVYDSCYGMKPVFRFYGARQNSHFFTVDAGECGGVRRVDPGWQYEGVAFGATMPADGRCDFGTPLYRLYNKRAAQNDSNHRFTTRTAVRDEMVARGWVSEGVAMCLYPHPGT
jgi:hypothetical protein